MGDCPGNTRPAVDPAVGNGYLDAASLGWLRPGVSPASLLVCTTRRVHMLLYQVSCVLAAAQRRNGCYGACLADHADAALEVLAC